MNERIKELAERSNLITHKIPNGLAHLHTEQDVENFAELIVRECAELVCGYFNERTFYYAGNTILEHFGIEQ